MINGTFTYKQNQKAWIIYIYSMSHQRDTGKTEKKSEQITKNKFYVIVN